MRKRRRNLCTYWPGDDETGEQVPEIEEEGHHNGRYLLARSQGNQHHPIHGEVGEAHEYEVVEIEELASFPAESNHRV